MGKEPREIEREIEMTRGRVGDDLEALATKVDVPGRAKGYVAEKTEGIRSMVGQTRDVVSAAPSRAGEKLGSAGQSMSSGMHQGSSVAQRNPLVLMAGAAALGVLAGSMLPTTRVEDEHLGPVSDRVKEQARSVGEDLVEHGKQVVSETADTARESAKRHGEEVTETIQSSASEMTGSGEDQGSTVPGTGMPTSGTTSGSGTTPSGTML